MNRAPLGVDFNSVRLFLGSFCIFGFGRLPGSDPGRVIGNRTVRACEAAGSYRGLRYMMQRIDSNSFRCSLGSFRKIRFGLGAAAGSDLRRRLTTMVRVGRCFVSLARISPTDGGER